MLTALKNAKKNKEGRKESDESDDGGGSSVNARLVTPSNSAQHIDPNNKVEIKSSKPNTLQE